MITKKEVLKALDTIEKYKVQEIQNINIIEIKSDNRSIDILNLPRREVNSLQSAHIYTIGELMAFNRRDLIKVRNLGSGGISKINLAIKNIGINNKEFNAHYYG